MKFWHTSFFLSLIGGCTADNTRRPPVQDEPLQLELTSDSAIAYLSCMADHAPLVNPIVLKAFSVSPEADLCQPEVYGIRFNFNDTPFLDNPVGRWHFSGPDGKLSLDSDEETHRWPSQLDEFRERETEQEYCIRERTNFNDIQLDITQWDWQTFEATYEGTLETGGTVRGVLTGVWRTDIVDCD